MSDLTLSAPPIVLSPRLYINRELSWLEFNSRVLHEAFDERNPLLERLKFAAIFSTNLDEFYMVRVAGLRRQLAANVTVTAPDGLSPQEQLDAIAVRVRQLLAQQQQLLHEQLLPALSVRGVRLVPLEEITAAEWRQLDEYFERQVYPVLTPLAVDPGHPFPYISNLSLSLAVEIRDPDTQEEHFARVKVPRSLPRWVKFGRPNQFIPLEQLIGINLRALFPGMEVRNWYAFRITRNSDIELLSSEEPDDLLATIEEQVFLRRFGEVVRLEVQSGTPPEMRSLLLDELRDDRLPPHATLTEADVHEMGPLLEVGDLRELASLEIPDLRDPPLVPSTPPRLRGVNGGMFDVIRQGDVLVHHPFDSFQTTVEQFIERAAEDDDVLAIKLTLYRTSGDTPIVRALTEAAESGKQVVVLVELKARFDETNNITWARQLESAGVHVVYGLMDLKTHTKTCLVVRREADGIRRYVHVGTGNYNSKTARQYTDLGLFTCSPEIGADLSDLFNFLTGFSRQRHYRKLIIAPGDMRARFHALIAREMEHARAGRPARLVAKMNALADPEAILALYEAAQAGVIIDLIVRGICCLRPGVEGISDNIRVTSIVGRFLEHSRLWYFLNDGEEEYFLGSADWMPRNFERRVEAVTPVEDKALHERLRTLLATYLRDNRNAWTLQPDGCYRQRELDGEAERQAQLIMVSSTWGSAPLDP
ncbi:MAG: polyphosphate kinase 1 [Gemmatimonadota bacterium]|nr:polyphosphate kinase 1 [Gemmatimonadota bacterium]